MTEPGRRVVLVTGGSQGIGAAIVTAFSQIGDSVISADLQPGQHGSGVDTMICDFVDPTAASRLVSHAVNLHGRIDVVVNNVGIAPYRDSFLDVTDDGWQHSIEINLMTMVRLCRAAIPVMVQAGRGAIVSIASDVARQPDPFFVDYAMTKAAIVAFTKSLSKQLIKKGVRVNAVAPGPVWTALQPSGGQTQEKVQHFGESAPLGRPGQPVELAPVYVLLASQEASFITGEVYGVTGGEGVV